jgi:transcriptional accessory protein Tex/SPT6
LAAQHRRDSFDLETSGMNSSQIPDIATRARLIANLRATRREIAEFNQELAEIEAQLDRELYAQKLVRIGEAMPTVL